MSYSITDLLSQLREITNTLDELDRMAAPVREKQAETRAAIHALMQETGTKTVEAHGLMAVRSNRKSVAITDGAALVGYLIDHKMIDTYQKFDEFAAKKDAVKNGWPGVEEVVTDVFSIREGKATS